VAERLIEDVIESTDSIIEEVARMLPENYPMDIAEAVFSGMKSQSAKLASAR
jgi:serine/threonine-protein kinase HipA